MNFEFNEIKIDASAVKALISGHPWIYRKKVLSEPKNSPWVCIKLEKTYYGIFEPLGPIAVRLFFQNTKPTIENMSERLIKLFDKRKDIALQKYNSNAFRLVHGELDDFPGMTIDTFSNLLVVQPYLQTWEALLPRLLNDLIKSNNLFCYVKHPKQRGTGKTGYFIGKEMDQDYVSFRELDHTFAAFYKSGQKTGFYLDLRELRKYLSGSEELFQKDILDLFASEGALTCIMKKKGASTTSVEISEQCAEHAKINHSLNGIEFKNSNWEVKNAWDKIKEHTDNKYDLIIIDPPNLATSKDQINNALRAWKQLNTFAIEHIKDNGTIISCNCSSRLTKEIHKKSIKEILKRKNISTKEFFFLKNTFDHPVSGRIPELDYLDISVIKI
jgi:23S rRNA (cytosine1962-C5)-methyltransferase